MQKPPLKILLAGPRGFCAGVDRAVNIVELALRKYGAPVYVRHEIVHNRYVVEALEAKGAVFVEELEEVPAGVPVVFSAHGVAKAVFAEAEERELFYLDATCPLVTKVHVDARRHEREGRQVILIGHAGHPEVIGTMGQLPEGAMILVETVEQAGTVEVKDPVRLSFVTQTTLSVDETEAIVEVLKERFPRDRAAAQGRHLLRHHQPAGRGQGDRRAVRRARGDRRAVFVQLQAARRGGKRLGLPESGPGPARERDR